MTEPSNTGLPSGLPKGTRLRWVESKHNYQKGEIVKLAYFDSRGFVYLSPDRREHRSRGGFFQNRFVLADMEWDE